MHMTSVFFWKRLPKCNLRQECCLLVNNFHFIPKKKMKEAIFSKINVTFFSIYFCQKHDFFPPPPLHALINFYTRNKPPPSAIKTPQKNTTWEDGAARTSARAEKTISRMNFRVFRTPSSGARLSFNSGV